MVCLSHFCLKISVTVTRKSLFHSAFSVTLVFCILSYFRFLYTKSKLMLISAHFSPFFSLAEHVKNVSHFVHFVLTTVSHSAGYTTRAVISQPRHPHLPIQLFHFRSTAVEHIFESRRIKKVQLIQRWDRLIKYLFDVNHTKIGFTLIAQYINLDQRTVLLD